MGNPDVQTPHIDQLASEGMLFRRTFANSPICCPARATILTGTYISRNGMSTNDLRLKEDEMTFSEVFARAGYQTAYIGKWHLDGGPREPGFIPPGPRRHGFEYWAANECNHNYFHNVYFHDTSVPIVDNRYEPEVWTGLAVDYLRKVQDKPFFLMLAFGAPHNPYIAPEKYTKLYDPQKLTMEPNWIEGIRGGSRQNIANYYAAITALDEQIGTLMKTLRELKLEDNTIVLFSSDHGNMLGSHGKILKRKPWEESIRVPGIMRYPAKIKPGGQSDALLSHIDFAPTLLSLCGLTVLTEMQGVDQSGVAVGRTNQGPDSVFFQILVPEAGEDPWRGIRTDRYMYARSATAPWVLYDLEMDPYEMHNLTGDPSVLPIMTRLDGMLLDWMHRTGDSWSLDWPAFSMESGLFRYGTFYSIQDYMDWLKKNPQVKSQKGSGDNPD
jgi:arylsulfatase A-like enzyme